MKKIQDDILAQKEALERKRREDEERRRREAAEKAKRDAEEAARKKAAAEKRAKDRAEAKANLEKVMADKKRDSQAAWVIQNWWRRIKRERAWEKAQKKKHHHHSKHGKHGKDKPKKGKGKFANAKPHKKKKH